MGRIVIKFIPTAVSIMFWVGLQMTGIVIPWLGYLLMAAAVLLLLIPGWPLIEKVYKQSENAKPKLRVEQSEFRPLKWVLKIKNESDEVAENCIGMLEMVVDEKPPANPSPDMFSGRRLMWEDTNSIPGRGAAILKVFNMINRSTEKTTWFEYIPAYEKPDFPYQLAFPNQNLIFVISLRSDGCRPLYTICYFYHKWVKDPGGMHVLDIVEANLEKRPTVEECRKKLTEHLAKSQS